MSKKELPSIVNRDTEPSFHLAAILRSDMYQWYYEHFVNMSFKCGTHGNFEFVDNYIDSSFRRLYDSRITYTYTEIANNIIALIKSSIERDYYIFTFTDKYSISTHSYYQQYHFVHPTLVTGYNDDECTVICIDFDPQHGPVKLNVPYAEFDIAVRDCKDYCNYGYNAQILDEMAVCFKLNNSFIAKRETGRRRHMHYSFSIERFASELHDYLHGTTRHKELYEPFQFNSMHTVYGTRIYDTLLEYFKRFMVDSNLLRFKVLHDLVLHKWMLLERLEYIQSRYKLSEQCCKSISDYRNVYNRLEQLRLINLKCNTRDKCQINSLSKNPKFAETFCSVIPEVQKLEYSILKNIYEELSKGVELKNNTAILYDDISREKLINEFDNERVYLNDLQTIYRIDIVIPPDTCEFAEIRLAINASSYVVSPEDIHRGYAVIELCPAQTVTQFTVNTSIEDLAEKLKYKLYTRSKEVVWNFNGNLFVNTELDSDLYIDKSIKAVISGRDPNIWLRADFSAEELKYVYIKYRTSCESRTAELFFIDYFHTTSKKKFAIAPSESMYEYIVDLSDHPDWKGMIQTMRFDPVNYDNISDSGICEIESITISSRMPVYDSEKQYTLVQGLNGWSYHSYDDQTTYHEMICTDTHFEAAQHSKVYIDSQTQTSAEQIASARIWTCPADGSYKVKCTAALTTSGSECKLSIKRNHKVLTAYTDSLVKDEHLTFEDSIAIERGETLRFEFYNANANTVEIVNLAAVIEKTAD